MKIQAAVAWEAGGTLSIEELDLDDPRDDEILVRVEACGVCHTDDNARLGRMPVVFPIILGHEGAGVVERVGGDVTRVGPGDRVLFTPDYCGRCEQCTLGLTPYCDQVVAVTFTGTRPDGSPRAHQDGRPVRASFFGQSSFATHSLVTERNIVPVPADAPLSYLAGFTCGVQAGAGAILNAMPVRPGSRVAIWGTGAVGLAAVMAAAASGADEIVALDRVGSRLELAAELGATRTIDTGGRELADVVREIVAATRTGVNVALDTTGNPAVIAAAVESLATHGTASVITSSGAPVTVPPGSLLLKGRSLRGSMGGHINPTVFIPRLLDLHARGRFPVDRLVANYPFAEVNTAIADSLSGATIKPVLTFDAGAQGGNRTDANLVDTSCKCTTTPTDPEVLRVAKPVLRVIIGSTRPGRVGPSVAEWIIERAREHGGFDVEVTDLAALNLPMFDEPHHPRLKQYVHQHTKDWSALADASDAFIFVIPEYNYSFNAATKNAVDYLSQEWAHKAAGIVSYGGIAAGTRATQALKQVLSTVKMVPVTEAVNIPFVFKHLDEDRRFKSTEEMEQAAAAMLDELQKWTEALLTLRAK